MNLIDLEQSIYKLEEHLSLPMFRYGDNILMTSQEFYQRFEKELKLLTAEFQSTNAGTVEVLNRKDILEVAKEAAGL